MSLARGIGRVIREATWGKGNPLNALMNYLALTHYGIARLLGAGKITDVSRQFRNGWAIGTVMIEPFDSGEPYRLQVQNENLIATRGDEVLAIVPDLICLLDIDTAAPLPTERLRYGQRVNILGIRAPEILRSDAALRIVGPRAFGIDRDYRMLI